MENVKDKYDSLLVQIKDYINNRLELTKLIALEKGSVAFSNAAAFFILVLLALFCFFFLNITLAIGLSILLGSTFYGFLLVAIFYLIFSILLYFNKKKWVVEPMSNIFIRHALTDYNDQNKQQKER